MSRSRVARALALVLLLAAGEACAPFATPAAAAPAGYMATWANAVIFLQWNQTGTQVSGTAFELFPAEYPDPVSHRFIGVVTGTSVTLNFTAGGRDDLTGTWVGHPFGQGFVLSYRMSNGSVSRMAFDPATVAQYAQYAHRIAAAAGTPAPASAGTSSTSTTGSRPATGGIALASTRLRAGGTLQASISVTSTEVAWWLRDAGGDMYPLLSANTSAVNVAIPVAIPSGTYTLYAQDNAGSTVHQYTAAVTVSSSWTGFQETGIQARALWDPFQVAQYEDITPLYAFGDTGQGTTIALFESSDLQASDLSQFDLAYGLPAPDISVVAPLGDPGVRTSAEPFTSPLDETTLDVEWAHALAPGAKIVLYLYRAPTEAELASAVAGAASSGDVAFSTSYSWNNGGASSLDRVLQAAASRGLGVFAAVGDHGTVASGPFVSWPATSPYVVAVGGTQLDTTGNTVTENYWNEGTDSSGTYWAGGFGTATGAAPAWQSAVTESTHRLLPDVSFLARDALVYENAQWTFAGGTSLSAPCWAAVWALVSAWHTLADGSPVALPAGEAIYRAAAATGASVRQDPAFAQKPGTAAPYSPQTGFGAPDVTNLALVVAALK